MHALVISKSLFYFILAGLFEIGGGYLVWLWLREGKSIGLGIMGGVILILYGVFYPAAGKLESFDENVNSFSLHR